MLDERGEAERGEARGTGPPPVRKKKRALLEKRAIALRALPPSLSTSFFPIISPASFQDGIVLGADTRSTAGSTVADKNCEKIHFIAPNIYCCGAGTAADTENVTGMVSSALALHRSASHRPVSRVITALTMLKAHLFKYQGHVSAALVLGGVDLNGAHLFTVRLNG